MGLIKASFARMQNRKMGIFVPKQLSAPMNDNKIFVPIHGLGKTPIKVDKLKQLLIDYPIKHEAEALITNMKAATVYITRGQWKVDGEQI